MDIKFENFGTLPDGSVAKLYTLTNNNNMIVKVTDYGAVLVSLFAPDKNGALADVVLGFDDFNSYLDNHCYFGATVGRNSNRIKNSSFIVNGETYMLDKNEGNNNLHSGFSPYNKRLWLAKMDTVTNSVIFNILSKDGDQGFPGNLNITVTYTLTDNNELKITYNGVADKDTVINMTNHSYFNLAGHNFGDATKQILCINSDKFVEVDSESIPTGNLLDVANTPMDFTSPKIISEEIDANFEQLKLTGGYDHSFVINGIPGNIRKCATLKDNLSGRVMEVFTDCIGVQFYAGNYINDVPQIGKGNYIYPKRSGICLETGFLPNSVNELKFVSPIFKANEVYNSTTIYKFVNGDIPF